MKTDVEELFKSTKPSFIQIIGGEISNTPSSSSPRTIKINYRYIGAGIGALVLIAVASAFFLGGEGTQAPAPKITPPTPFFATESARTLTTSASDRNSFLRLMADSYQEREREGIIKRIIQKLKDGPAERFATMADFAEAYRMAPPRTFLDFIVPPLMTFFYYGSGGGNFGFIVKTSDPERTLRDMLAWEPSLINDLRLLFYDRKPETTIAPFEDRTYRNIDWRYQKLSQTQDSGIGYAIFPARNLLVVTTSKESMEVVINRLFDAR